MKIWPLAALMLVSLGCGAYQFPGETPSPAAESGQVSGRVVAVPCAPVERGGIACPGRPVPNLELDYYYAGTGPNFSQAVTDGNGNYAVELRPGSYMVKLKTYMRVLSGPLKLLVQAGSSTTANYVLDSGIRVPVPVPVPAPQK